jgi:hypothetical protein
MAEWMCRSTDISWRWVVSFTPLPLYPRGKSHRYPLHRLGGLWSRNWLHGEREILDLTGTLTSTPSVVQLVDSRCTDSATAVFFVVHTRCIFCEIGTAFKNIVYFSYQKIGRSSLEVLVHPEGPATGHVDKGFLGFPLSSSKMLRFPVYYFMGLPTSALIRATKLPFQIMRFNTN